MVELSAQNPYRGGMNTTSSESSLPHVVVIGGGFGGIEAVRGLRNAKVRVTLVDQNPYTTFQPLLYQVATSTLNPGDVTYFLRAMRTGQPNLQVELGRVAAMDHAERTVTLDRGKVLHYDYLVIATGVSANFFNIPGAEEHSWPMYTREQALAVRDRIGGLLDAASRRHGSKFRVVIVGGGPTGVEMAGALAEMRNKDLPVVYPEIQRGDFDITLVDMAERVLGKFGEDSSSYTHDALEERGVRILLSEMVEEVREDGVVLKNKHDGEVTVESAALVVWASGVGIPDEVSEWGLPQTKQGRILVDDRLQVKDFPRVFAVGDVASIGDHGLPQLAQPALQMGQHAAKVIAARVAACAPVADAGSAKRGDDSLLGKVTSGLRRAVGHNKSRTQAMDPGPFVYKDLGILATIGRADAVAEATNLPNLRGFPAWMIWNGVHIATLMGGRNRLASFVNLTSKYLLWHRNHNLIVGDITKFSKQALNGNKLSASRQRTE